MYWTRKKETYDKCGENVSEAYTNYIASPWFSGNVTYSSLVRNDTPSAPVRASDSKNYTDSGGCGKKTQSVLFDSSMSVVGFSAGSYPGYYGGNAIGGPISIRSLSPVLGTKRVTTIPQSVPVSNYVRVDSVAMDNTPAKCWKQILSATGRKVRVWESVDSAYGCGRTRTFMKNNFWIRLNDARVDVDDTDYVETGTYKFSNCVTWQDILPIVSPTPRNTTCLYTIIREFKIYATPTLAKVTTGSTSSVRVNATAPGSQTEYIPNVPGRYTRRNSSRNRGIPGKHRLGGVAFSWKMIMGGPG